jgi:hypothetical protein
MTDEQKAQLQYGLEVSAKHFAYLGYPTINDVLAGIMASVLMAWGLENSKEALAEAAKMLHDFQKTFILVP